MSTKNRTPPRSYTPPRSGITDRLAELHKHKTGTLMEDEHLYGDKHPEFTKLFKVIEQKLERIATCTSDIKGLHHDVIRAVQPHEVRKQQDDIEDLLDHCAGQFISISQALKVLQKNAEVDSQDTVWLRNQYNVVLGQTQRQLEEFQKTSNDITDHTKAQIKRRIRSRYGVISGAKRNADVAGTQDNHSLPKVGTQLTEREIDQLAEQLMVERRENAIYEESVQTLARIQTQHSELLSIESNVRELNRMFADLHLLVIEQDPFFDDVVDNLEKANTNVKEGRKQLAQARDFRERHSCLIM